MRRARRLKPVEERFSKYVSPEPISGCWLWTGAYGAYGYGVLNVRKKAITAHRLSWMLNRGPIDSPHTLVCHKCDNRACVNPEHLFLGNHADNQRDMAVKCRGTAKFSDDQVREIRKLSSGGLSNKQIAAIHGAKRDTIYKIVIGKNRRHV